MSPSEVTQAARVSYMTVGFLLEVYSTLEEVKRSHGSQVLYTQATALELAAAGQTLEAKDIETAHIGGVIERLSGDACKHDMSPLGLLS